MLSNSVSSVNVVCFLELLKLLMLGVLDKVFFFNNLPLKLQGEYLFHAFPTENGHREGDALLHFFSAVLQSKPLMKSSKIRKG
jgi:hypothetical protein